MSTVDIASYHRVDKTLKSGVYTALIAIGPPFGEQSTKKTLQLTFNDTTPNKKPDKGLATGNDVLALIRFCRRLTPQDKVLIQCKAGRSRSAAAALVAMYCLGMNEDGCVRSLFGRYHKSNPNGWVLKLADAMLDSHLFDSCRKVRVKW